MSDHFDDTRFPVPAAQVIAKNGIHEPIFTLDSWGGYLIFRFYPEMKVFVDDRHDLYGEQFLRESLTALRLGIDAPGILFGKYAGGDAPMESCVFRSGIGITGPRVRCWFDLGTVVSN